jgi:hypothetical protein
VGPGHQGEKGGSLGWWAEEVGWTAWASRQAKAGGVGKPAGPSGLNSVEKNFRIKNWIFEYTKALEICRRFRRNFEVGIFPKFF